MIVAARCFTAYPVLCNILGVPCVVSPPPSFATEGVFLADIDLISVDWGLAMLGVLQLVVAVAVMYALNPIGRKPLLIYGEYGGHTPAHFHLWWAWCGTEVWWVLSFLASPQLFSFGDSLGRT